MTEREAIAKLAELFAETVQVLRPALGTASTKLIVREALSLALDMREQGGT